MEDQGRTAPRLRETIAFVLNKGLARWQLTTGTTLIEGWVRHLGRWAQGYLLAYLVLWSFIVGGTLILGVTEFFDAVRTGDAS